MTPINDIANFRNPEINISAITKRITMHKRIKRIFIVYRIIFAEYAGITTSFQWSLMFLLGRT